MVKEKQGAYWTDLAVIKFERDGTVSGPEDFMPSDNEAMKIQLAFTEYEFPIQQTVKGLTGLPESLKNVASDDLFKFTTVDGDIIMLQHRREGKDGGKIYVPWTYWSDGEWRSAEPEGPLPLWGMDQLKNAATVFIHEGAKAARAMRKMTEAMTKQDKERLAAHPWGAELSAGAHVGWIGGALSPARTDWGVLKQLGVKTAYIVSDNDAAGLSAVSKISYRLRMPTFHLQFTAEWPASFDLADEFPDKMFKELNGVRHYIGPSWHDCIHSATWATDAIPNEKGRPTIVLRPHFKEQWQYVEEADLFVCVEMPEIVRSESIANKMMSAFSHSPNTTALILKNYTGRATKICYRPDKAGQRMVTYSSTSAINLYVPSRIKSVGGSVLPFIEFMAQLIPDEKERYELERWCATLIAQPGIKMNYGVLLISEMQGVGKTTLGDSILATLIGEANVSWPDANSFASDFNSWAGRKRLAVVNEIYHGRSWKVYNSLKSIITDPTITVNEKYEKPYTIDNFIHIFGSSNSSSALKMAQNDRRWLVPAVTEKTWLAEKFKKFHKWLAGGGVQNIQYWAENFDDYVEPGDNAPTTLTKNQMMHESLSDAELLAIDIAEYFFDEKSPVVLKQRELRQYIGEIVEGKIFATDKVLIAHMLAAGLKAWPGRVSINGLKDRLLLNQAAQDVIDKLEPNADVNGVLRELYANTKYPDKPM